MFTCKICNVIKKSQTALIRHLIKDHNIDYRTILVDHFGIQPTKCKMCDNEGTPKPLEMRFAEYCSMKCKSNDPEYLEYRKQCFREKLGVDNPAQLNSSKEKIKQSKKNKSEEEIQLSNKKREETNIEKYGVKNIRQSEIYQESFIKTCQEKYQTNHYWANKEIQELSKKTTLERHGVEKPLQSNKFKDKLKETWKNKTTEELQEIKDKHEKFYQDSIGYNHIWSSPEGKLKRKETWLKELGVDNPSKNLEIREKIKKSVLKTIKSRYDVSNSFNIPIVRNACNESKRKKSYENISRFTNVKPLFTFDEYSGCGYNKLYLWKCNVCGHEFIQSYWSAEPRCLICNPYLKGTSSGEQELFEFISSLTDKIVLNKVKYVISPKELDIYIPDMKLAFEFNGLYWHTSEYINSSYHLDKTKACQDQGIKLIHIWEDDWINKQDIIKSRIKNLFGLSEKIMARKCQIKQISFNESCQFLNNNHLQGQVNGKDRLGLFYNNELIALAVFGKSRFEKNKHELYRYCTKQGINVIGGITKLLSYYKKNNKNTILVSYADRCWGNGSYEKMGFSKILETPPGFSYVIDGKRVNRMAYMKKKLIEDGHDSHLSAEKIMSSLGFYQLYDCGNIKYEITI